MIHNLTNPTHNPNLELNIITMVGEHKHTIVNYCCQFLFSYNKHVKYLVTFITHL